MQVADRRAPLTIVVDGVKKAADVIVLLRPNDALVGEQELIDAHVPLTGATFITIEGKRYASLASLAPHVTYRVNEAALALDITVDAASLDRNKVSLGGYPTYSHAARADPSGFLTYSLSSNDNNLEGSPSAFMQVGAGSAAAGLFTASASYAQGDGHRGLIAYQRDSEPNLSRFTAGDGYASTTALGASTVIGGISFTRHFDFEPGYAYFPTPGLSGTVLSPTTADVYANGAFVGSVQLAPGSFDLSNINVPPGAGVTQVVLHDAYGNTQTISGLYYQTKQLLRKGMTDYDYYAGFLRATPFGPDDRYGPFAALGQYRLGISDAVTVGARFERTAGLVSGGPQLDFGLPIGRISLEAGLSDAFSISGTAYGAGYEYVGRRFGVSVSTQIMSANYATASLAPLASRQRSNVHETLGFPIAHGATFNVTDTTTTYTALPAANQLIATLNLRPRRGLLLGLNAERDSGGSIFGIGGASSAARWTFGPQLTIITGATTNITTGMTTGGGTGSTNVELSKSTPMGPGFGYQFEQQAGTPQFTTAQVNYQTQYVNFQGLENSQTGTPTFTVSGGLVGFKQGVFFTEPVSGGYTLVDVPGFAGLPVFYDGSYAGKTDGRDAMVIPNLSAYYDNGVSIDDLHNRLDLTVEQSLEQVRPKTLSGVVSTFHIDHFHAYSGFVLIRRSGKDVVPALGQLVLAQAGKNYPLDLGRDGQFYVENLTSGTFAATATTVDGLSCSFHIDFPDEDRTAASPVTAIGTVTCEVTP